MGLWSRAVRLVAAWSALLVALVVAPARAAAGGGDCGSNHSLQALEDQLTGPEMATLATIVLFSSCAALVFGDERSAAVKRALVLIMSLALLVIAGHVVARFANGADHLR